MMEAIAAKSIDELSGQRFTEPGHSTFSRVRVAAASAHSSLFTLTMAIQKEVGPLAPIGTFRSL